MVASVEVPKTGTVDELRNAGLEFFRKTFAGLEEYEREGDVSSHMYQIGDKGRRLFCLTYKKVV